MSAAVVVMDLRLLMARRHVDSTGRWLGFVFGASTIVSPHSSQRVRRSARIREHNVPWSLKEIWKMSSNVWPETRMPWKRLLSCEIRFPTALMVVVAISDKPYAGRLIRFENWVYYVLPLYEYLYTLDEMRYSGILNTAFVDRLTNILHQHHDHIQSFVQEQMTTVGGARTVEFIYPMKQQGHAQLTPNEAYMWPYQNLNDVDVALEEMEELRIAYQTAQQELLQDDDDNKETNDNGDGPATSQIPPVLLGALSFPRPFQVRRRGQPPNDDGSDDNWIVLSPSGDDY